MQQHRKEHGVGVQPFDRVTVARLKRVADAGQGNA